MCNERVSCICCRPLSSLTLPQPVIYRHSSIHPHPLSAFTPPLYSLSSTSHSPPPPPLLPTTHSLPLSPLLSTHSPPLHFTLHLTLPSSPPLTLLSTSLSPPPHHSLSSSPLHSPLFPTTHFPLHFTLPSSSPPHHSLSSSPLHSPLLLPSSPSLSSPLHSPLLLPSPPLSPVSSPRRQRMRCWI